MAKAVQVIFTIKDNKGKLSTTAIKIPTGISLPNMVEFAQEAAVLVDAVTIGQIVNVGLAITVDTSALGLTPVPGATSDVEEKGTFQYMSAANFRTSTRIPCWSDLNVVTGSDEVDLTDADVIAFNNMMVNGLVLPVGAITVQPCDIRESDIISLDWARERFRASGKR